MEAIVSVIIAIIIVVLIGALFMAADKLQKCKKSKPVCPKCPQCPQSDALKMHLENLWREHVMWTREYMIAKLNSLKELELIKAKLMDNHDAIISMYATRYGKDNVTNLSALLHQHIGILDEILNALGVKGQVDISIIHMWQQNGVDIANALSKLLKANKALEAEIMNALAKHLSFTMEEIGNYVNKNFGVSIQNYEYALDQIVGMGSYF